MTAALASSTRASAISKAGQSRRSAARSRLIPTVIRNNPSAKPLRGAVTCSTSLRYSVSAISTPAMSAPRIGDRPIALVARLARITVSRLTARNSSGLLVRAACANNGGRSRRRRSASLRSPARLAIPL